MSLSSSQKLNIANVSPRNIRIEEKCIFIYRHINVVPGRGASKGKFPHENARNPTLFQSRVSRTSESIEKLLTKMIQVVTRGDTVCV